MDEEDPEEFPGIHDTSLPLPVAEYQGHKFRLKKRNGDLWRCVGSVKGLTTRRKCSASLKRGVFGFVVQSEKLCLCLGRGWRL
jgi:hypothetical protein